MNHNHPLRTIFSVSSLPGVLLNAGIRRWLALLIMPALLLWCARPGQAALIQHLDATVVASVTKNGSGVVSQWADQSGAANHALPAVGSVLYPSTSLSASGKTGLNFGATRNSLELFTAAESDSWLNQAGSTNGFCVLVAFKCDGINPDLNDLIGNSTGVNSGFGMRYGGGNYQVYLNGLIGVGGTLAVNDTIVMALNYNAGTGVWTFWDSKSGNPQTGTKAAADFSTTSAVTLGSTTSANRYINGMVSEVKIYDRALSLADFQIQRDAMAVQWIGGPPVDPPVPPGPGFPKVTQTSGAMLSQIHPNAAVGNNPRTIGLDFINGYLVLDSRGVATDGSGSSIQVWNISNPTNPTEIVAARTGIQNPMHTYSMLLPHHRISADGDEVNNVRDPLNIIRQTPSGYTPINNGARGLTVFPYQYSGGSSVQIYDTKTGTLLSTINHGFEGTSTPIGNLLIVASIRGQDSGLATYDISDPSNPLLLDLIGPNDPLWQHPEPSYEYFMWKHYLVMPNSFTTTDSCAFIDFSNPSDLRYLFRRGMNGQPYSRGLPGRTRYAQFQDHKMFLGFGIYDMRPLDNNQAPILLGVHPHDGEYMLPLGNLFVSAANMEQGGIRGAIDVFGQDSPTNGFSMRIFAHQAAPDTVGPTVAYHNPASGAVNMHVKSRIGVIIHETLDYLTIHSNTFRVFPVAGGSDVAGTLNWHDKDVLTFTPNANLAPGTTYRVQLVAGGIKDVSGNGITGYSFDFTTAGAGGGPPISVTNFTSAPYPAPVNGTANLSVTASGGTAPLQYSWTFGDGSTQTAYSASAATISHTYTNPGHYSVLLRVRDSSPSPQTVTRSTVVTVTPVPSGAASTNGSQMVLDGTNRRMWTVNPDNNTVTSINADTLAKVSEFAVGNDPRSLARDASGNLWITCLDADRLEVRSTTGALVGSINFRHGSRPHDVVFNAAKTYAYVTLMGSGRVARINPSATPLRVDVELAAGGTAAAIAVNAATDKLLVNRFISPNAQGEVRLFNNAGGSMSLAQTIALGVNTNALEQGTSARGLPNYLADVAIDPFNQFAYVTAKQDNILRGGFRDGQPLTHETTVRAIVSKINLTSNTEVSRLDIDDASQPSAMVFSPLGDYLFIALQGNNQVRVMDTFTGQLVSTLPTGLAPQGLCFDAVSNRLFINSLTDRKVTVYDLDASLKRGGFPQTPIATISTVATETFPANVLRGKQVFYNAADPRMSREGYLNCAICHQDGDHDGRTWDFTNRGEGLRNTTNLRGRAGAAHGNVHWSANFDEIQDFELDIVNAFGGTGFLSTNGGANASLGAANAGRSADLDALAAFVASLGAATVEKSPNRNTNGTLTYDAVQGKRLFAGTKTPAAGNPLNCLSCHKPATGLTDSTIGNNSAGAITLHNVGTIKSSSGQRLGGGTNSLSGIDTPTLLGVHAAAPYLHDGSATSLAAVFDQFVAGAARGTDGSAHNLSATGYNLNSAEKTQLYAYLGQIDGGGDADFAAPSAPTGFTATAGSGSVSLDWANSTASDFASYTVYRRILGGSFGLPFSTGLASSSYVDNTVVSGTTYQYRVTAMDTNGNESGLSSLLTVTPGAVGAWRETYFGSAAGSGNSADTFDFDNDGLVNLLEFAFGLDPTAASSVQLPAGQVIADSFVVTFQQPIGVSGITYGAEWSETLLPGSWTEIPDTGTDGQHTFDMPIGTKNKLFMRLKVTNP